MATNKQRLDADYYDAPYDVHGTDCSPISGVSPEMEALTKLTMYSNSEPVTNIMSELNPK